MLLACSANTAEILSTHQAWAGHMRIGFVEVSDVASIVSLLGIHFVAQGNCEGLTAGSSLQ